MIRASACAAFLAGVLSAAPPGRDARAAEVVIESSGIHGGGTLRPSTLSRLLAWRKGELYVGMRLPVASLNVKRIIQGELGDPGFPGRPVGVNSLDVIVVDDAAMALGEPEARDGAGEWTFAVLPDGSYLVSDLEKTPFRGRDITPEKKAVADIARGLESGDPALQYQALRRLKETRCFALVPAVLPLLDSEAKVTVPDAIHWDGPRGGGVLPAESTLGAEARSALARMVAPFRGRHWPGRRDGEAAWREWWQGILATEPFPKVKVAPGEVRVLTTLPMNQSMPVLRLDPVGRHAVIGVSRLEHIMHGARSGIRLLSVDATSVHAAPEDDFIYKAPLDERNCEPSGVAVAFGEDRIAVAWKEYFYDDTLNRVKFMSLDPGERGGVPVDLGLRRTCHIAMCRLGPERWLLACTAKPADIDPQRFSDRYRRELFLLALNASGEVLARTPPLGLAAVPMCRWHDMIGVMSVTAAGPALVYANHREGAFLVLLGGELEVRRVVQVDDPRESGHGFMPRLASNGDTLCVGWIQLDNDGYRLFVRAFDLEGEALSDASVLSEEAGTMAGPVAAGGGFVIAWTDFTETADQVRLSPVAADGAVGARRVAFDGREMVNPICLGAAWGKARMMMYYRRRYPHEVLLKDVAMTE